MKDQIWKILIVDNNPADRAEIRRLLLIGAERRYQFIEAETGAACRQRGQGQEVDCLILNSWLPDMTVFEILTELRQGQDVTCCPVLVLTEAAGRQMGREVQQAGAMDYLGKSWMTPESLTHAVETTIERWLMRARDASDRQRREANAALLDGVSHDLARLSNPVEMMQVSSEKIGGHFKAFQVFLVEVDESAGLFKVLFDWGRADLPSMVGQYPILEYVADSFLTTLVSGASVAIRDIATDPHTAAAAARFAALQLGAVVCVPYISAGRLKSLLVIGHRAAYDWRSDEIELTRALTARLWPAIERAQTEEKLREAEQRFRATFEQAPVGIAHVTPDGRWLLVNRRLCEITGYSAAELLSRTFQDLTHPADLATDLDFMHRVLAGKMAGYAMEKRYYRQDGSLVWVNLTVSLVRDAAGEPKYFITVIEDITERKQGEEKLRESEERFRSVFESIDEGFCIVEMIFDEANRPVDYRFLQINPVFAQLTGLEDAIGKTARELVPELEEFWFETYGRVALTGEAIRFENGSVPMGRWFDVHASRVGGADSRRVAIIFNNITARKRAEEGQQLLAETSRLLPTSLHVTDRLETVGQLFVKEFADWCMLHLLAADGSLPLAIAEHREPEKTALIYELGQAYPLVAPAAEDTAPVMGPKQARLYESFPASLLAGHSQDPLFFRPSLELLGAGSTLLAPLVVREQTLGFITLVRAGSRPTFDHTDLTLIEEVAYRTAIALDNAYLYEAERAARLEAEAAQKSLALLAETRERNRLAQELHDTVAQALGYLNLKIAMTQSLLASNQPEAVKANLQELKQVIGETYTDVREEIFYLRSKALSDLGFMELLERYIDKYRRFYKLEVELVQEADPALFEFQPETTSQLIRTIQEALINIRKHARVNTATIRLAEDKGAIRISIEDEGQGFDLVQSQGQNSSFGLLIMRERVESVGGSLKIETSPGQGTRVIVYRFAP